MEEDEFNNYERFQKDGIVEEKNSTTRRTRGGHRDEIPTCVMCMETLGTYGGPASLACGHNGCLECLQQVQMHSNMPVCPLCPTPFGGDGNIFLNLELRAALERAEAAATLARAADSKRTAAASNSNSNMDAQVDKGHGNRRRFMYDSPYPEETGPWIPVSVPPKGSKDFEGPDTGSA